MARATRMETKQRLHKRFQYGVGVNDNFDGTYSRDNASKVGRVARPDYRGFPVYGGCGPEALVVAV